MPFVKYSLTSTGSNSLASKTNEISPTVIITRPVASLLMETVIVVFWISTSSSGSKGSMIGSSGTVTLSESVAFMNTSSPR